MRRQVLQEGKGLHISMSGPRSIDHACSANPQSIDRGLACCFAGSVDGVRLQQHLDFALQAHECSEQARQQAGDEPLLTRARQRAGGQAAQRLALSQLSQVGRLRRWVSQQGHVAQETWV